MWYAVITLTHSANILEMYCAVGSADNIEASIIVGLLTFAARYDALAGSKQSEKDTLTSKVKDQSISLVLASSHGRYRLILQSCVSGDLKCFTALRFRLRPQ